MLRDVMGNWVLGFTEFLVHLCPMYETLHKPIGLKDISAQSL